MINRLFGVIKLCFSFYNIIVYVIKTNQCRINLKDIGQSNILNQFVYIK